MAKARKSFRNRMDATFKKLDNDPMFNRGFSKIDMWVSCQNYAMNRRWSGRFDRSFLFGRNYIFYGESGSGKSLMAAIAAADAQKQHDAYVIWMDFEHANDDEAGEQWLKRAGLDVDPENFDYISAATLEEAKVVITGAAKNLVDMMKEDGEMRPVVVVIDSWAAALTESQADKVAGKEAGKIVGDMGQKAKQTGDVILAATHACAGKPMMVIGVHHIMDNQDGYGRKHKTTGGHKIVYLASGAMMLTKKELKDEDIEDEALSEQFSEAESKLTAEAKKKLSNIKGITSTMEILKSRVSKPFEKVYIQIPYSEGIDPYSGLFELLMQEGVVTNPSQGWYMYMDGGKEVKFRKKDFRDHADRIMEVASEDIASASPSEGPTEEEVTAIKLLLDEAEDVTEDDTPENENE